MYVDNLEDGTRYISRYIPVSLIPLYLSLSLSLFHTVQPWIRFPILQQSHLVFDYELTYA
jgi:hypothetical protein